MIINTIQLEYSIRGKENQETILFVHGAGGSMIQFQRQQEFFSEQYKVVLISLRGHGDSPKPIPNTTEQYALTLFAEDIIQLIKDLDLVRIHFVGNSAGGVLGFLVVSQTAERFASLTTFGTTGQMKFPKFLAPVFRGFDALMLRYFKNWYLNLMADQTAMNASAKEVCLQMFVKAVAAIPHFRYNLVNYDFTGFISQSTVPYTLIRCEFDKGINGMLKSTLKAIEANPSAKVIDLNGVGHVGNLDNPTAFNNCLKDILNKLP
ncbi:alpha/beta fold hydrolase [Mongoliitalea lutea]|uniref:2-succinyl-6-hydroxy-2, 4-cyclohexadiene-1-carboxylate synthase n=1 Tax=Mongoliitalea lutea TaxID=849756 RepID=A0A8J3CV35_9BACT|nr:alpha/beta hydrolase [Mongoliitalea lutea]GHB25476.1 2-succinyl-6-hydroxy-2,4-cyclohexadiene-1-carboxylate synthase [Mongoliitalea lutea]